MHLLNLVLIGLATFFSIAVSHPLDDQTLANLSPEQRIIAAKYPDRMIPAYNDTNTEASTSSTLRTAGAPGGLWACSRRKFGGKCKWYAPGISGPGKCHNAHFGSEGTDILSFGPDEGTACGMFVNLNCEGLWWAPNSGDGLWMHPGTDWLNIRIASFMCFPCDKHPCPCPTSQCP